MTCLFALKRGDENYISDAHVEKKNLSGKK